MEKSEEDYKEKAVRVAGKLLNWYGLPQEEEKLLQLEQAFAKKGELMVSAIAKRIEGTATPLADDGPTWQVSPGGNQAGTFQVDWVLRNPQKRKEVAKTLATRLCTALYEKLAVSAEMQAMLFDDGSIVIAANQCDAQAILKKNINLRELIESYAKELAGSEWNLQLPSEAYNAHKANKVRELNKLINEPTYAGTKASGAINQNEMENFLAALETIAYKGAIQEGGNSFQCSEWLLNKKTTSKVFWLTTQGDCHAEQALATALLRSGKTYKATIAGTMRNCLTCWLVLKFGADKGLLNLTFSLDDNPPGGYWEKSSEASMESFIDAASSWMIEQGKEDIELSLSEEETEDSVHRMVAGALVKEFDEFVALALPGSNVATSVRHEQRVKNSKIPSAQQRGMPSPTHSDDERVEHDNRTATENGAKPKPAAPKPKSDGSATWRVRCEKGTDVLGIHKKKVRFGSDFDKAGATGGTYYTEFVKTAGGLGVKISPPSKNTVITCNGKTREHGKEFYIAFKEFQVGSSIYSVDPILPDSDSE
ncbi:hypothetical protein LG634_07115 [Streptomyces bambusae]|uniref:hypothetical protein n=1 Tax=Streptomyces bambusae TaxID=1550616 RepID=UPI001CFC94BE|nr:hypothetical protein [Streptomyces bambusae]MCB5164603.1 hypothetical protein [Streptomyces bambusae]